jgi:ribosome-binding factor A
MASPIRRRRINELLKEELSRLLHRELKDPRVRSVTVTAVETTADLALATVFVRSLAEDPPVEEAIEGLQSAAGYIRRTLGRELHLRRIPELRFLPDRALERAQHIEALLDEAMGGEGTDEPDAR